MAIKYFVEEKIIPDDGSKNIIERFHNQSINSDPGLEVLVFPDVHYKKGSRVSNGMLTSSPEHIHPAMLGVANCGFTFGLLKNVSVDDLDTLEKSFSQYSKSLKAYNKTRVYSDDYIKEQFSHYAKVLFNDKNNRLADYCNYSNEEEFIHAVYKILSRQHIKKASCSLGTLGGGNHFFELQYVEESYTDNIQKGDVIFILHSDSIAVGNKINLLYSNQSELWHLKGFIGLLGKLYNRLIQLHYFTFVNPLITKEPGHLLNLIANQDDYRCIPANTNTGKSTLLAYNVAAIFGEMNRNKIIENYQKSANASGIDLEVDILGSHSHDSLFVEEVEGKKKIVHRNGVQKIGKSGLFILPGALGTDSYLMESANNEQAYYSANHGVGRNLDKHLAKEQFNNQGTEAELKKRGLKLFRIGSGNISEQHPGAFKDVSSVVNMMTKFSLGNPVAKLYPVASMKG